MSNNENTDKLDIMQKTAFRIKKLRSAKGLSQEALALAAGINPAYLGHVERCLKCPTIDTLNKIAAAFQMTLSELLCFDTGSCPDGNSEAIERIRLAIRGLPASDANRIAGIVEEIVYLRNE